ncbi:MAG TPA: phage tail protein [Actinomycetes bacterium]|nr:phage tail protein [Actinomycetes bacterium]
MALPDPDASVGHSFGLEFDGVVIKHIAEVSGLEIGSMPARIKAGEVTLTRGLTGDSSFQDWIRASRFGKLPDVRNGGAIIVFDAEGTAIKRYTLVNAGLKTLGRGARTAGGVSVLTETLVLTHEGCEADRSGGAGADR